MDARGVWAVLASTAMVCVACGSSSQSSGGISQSTASKLPLSAYLVRGQEEAGLPPKGRASHYLTATEWTSNGVPNGAAEAKRLTQEGFREAISVQTGSSKGDGVSWVMELGPPPRPRERRPRSYRSSPTGRRHRARRASQSRASLALRAGDSRTPTPTSCSRRGGA